MKALSSAVKFAVIGGIALSFASGIADAKSKGRDDRDDKIDRLCKDLPDHRALEAALKQATFHADPTKPSGNGGFSLHMWGTVVNRSGRVCAVAHTGADVGDQWPGSRVISAQKAYTANAFSLPGLALSTANLYGPVQPGGSLFGLQHSNPVNPGPAYHGSFKKFGTKHDPMVGHRIGGVNVFGGGVALYNSDGKLVGAIGVSGDSSCADHNIAWRARNALELDYVPGGVSPAGDDNIIYGTGGFKHPDCGNGESAIADLPPVK